MLLNNRRFYIYSFLFFLVSLLIHVSCATENKQVYTLNTSVEPAEAGAVTPTTQQSEDGSSIQVTATPNEFWKLIGWSGDLSGTDEPTVFVRMDKDRNITALFEKVEFPVTIHVEGEGSVSREVISQKSTTEDFPHATVLRLTAEPEEGWKFAEWSGDGEGSDPKIDVEVGGPIEITATFERIDYKLTVNTIGQGSVTQTILPALTTETEYPFETRVQLNAVPANNWEFSEWSGDATGTNPEVIVDMKNEKVVNAHFVTKPTVVTKATTSIGENTAVAGGEVTSSGGREVTDRGICYGLTPGGEGLVCKSYGSGTGSFSAALTDLKPGTTYYYVAYATNSVGTSVGGQLNFKTEITFVAPKLTTKAVTDITANTASSGGQNIESGGLAITQKGVCVNSSPNVTLANKLGCTDNGTGTGDFNSSLSGMNPNTTYYVRAYATNQVGTGYGNEISFKTAEGSSSPSSPTNPPPSSGGVQIALVFLDGVNLDVTLNGKSFASSTPFDYTVGGAGVKVVSLSSTWETMHLNKNQITNSSLNNEGFGKFSYKVVNKNASADLYNINRVDDGNENFWGQQASTNGLGIINNRSGDTVYGSKYPDSLFYLGWRYDPVNQPNNRTFEKQWSNTGKITISFLNLGVNHDNPAVP